jgi:hypothetical protein
MAHTASVHRFFSDRMMRPSVDRAVLRDSDPGLSRFASSDGVLQLTAEQVRSITETRNNEKGRPVAAYVADVEPAPLPENPSHAEIFGRPGFDNKSVFRRVCERLAQLATWAMLPADLTPPDTPSR